MINVQAITKNNSVDEREPGLEPKKFVLWMLIVSSIMLFAGLTSAFIVRRGEGNWDVFALPKMFGYTTGLILLSSAFMFWAVRSAGRDEILKMRVALALTFILGICFGVMQVIGYKELIAQSVYFAFDNPSGSFVYVLTGLHLAHVFIGLCYLAVIFVLSLQYKVHKKNLRAITMCGTFWHFIGVLWIYLYVFLLIYR